MKKVKFSEDEIKYIEENYPYEQNYLIAEHLGCSTKKISQYAYYHKLKKADDFVTVRCDSRFSLEEFDYIIENFSNKTNEEMAEHLGCETKYIAAFARRHNLKKMDVSLLGSTNMTPEQKRFILDNYATMLTVDISKAIGVKCDTIRSYANFHGVKRDRSKVPMMVENKNGLTNEQKKFIIENYDSIPNREICKKLDITQEQLRSYSSNRDLKKGDGVAYKDDHYFEKCLQKRNKNGYSKELYLGSDKEPVVEQSELYKSKYGKYYVNPNYFEKIDNEWKAYWLGFLYADGCVIKKRSNGKNENVVSLALSSVDKIHVEKFQRSIQSTHPIATKPTNYKDTMSVKISVINKNLVDDLCKLGCVPNKSLILKFPTDDIVPKNLIRHFIRGYFDGDGCISINLEKRFARVNMMGTRDFLETIVDILHNECGWRKTPICQKKGNSAFYIQSGYIRGIENFYKYLYRDSNIYLDRKLKKFDTVFSLE